MKRFISLALVAVLSATFIGCEASGSVGDDEYDHEHHVTKKETVYHRDGDRTVERTDVRVEHD